MTADLHTTITLARLDLHEAARLYRWADALAWSPGTGFRENTRFASTVHSPAPHPGDVVLRDCMRTCAAEIARVHRTLGKLRGWVIKPWRPERILGIPAEARRHVHRDELSTVALLAAAMLDTASAHLDRPDVARVVTEACHHATAALRAWPDGVRNPPQPPPRCRHCEDKPVESGKKWCSRCRKAHQPNRVSCQVCGLRQVG